jgi:transposase
MARRGDGAKRLEWSERLERFARSEVTAAAFCQAEGVSLPSFYQWRRKLATPSVCEPAQERRSAGQAPRTFVQLIPTAGTAAIVEIQLPNGARICLPSDDRQLLAAAISAAGQVSGASGQQLALHEGAAAC